MPRAANHTIRCWQIDVIDESTFHQLSFSLIELYRILVPANEKRRKIKALAIYFAFGVRVVTRTFTVSMEISGKLKKLGINVIESTLKWELEF